MRWYPAIRTELLIILLPNLAPFLSNLAPFLPNLAPFFIDNFIAQSRTIFFVHFAQSPLQTHFLRQTAIKNPCTYNLSWQAKADYMSQRAYSGI